MDIDTATVAVAEARSSDKFGGSSGVYEKFPLCERVVVAAGPLAMGGDVVEVVMASAGSFDLILEVRVAGADGGSLTFMLEDIYLVEVDGEGGGLKEFHNGFYSGGMWGQHKLTQASNGVLIIRIGIPKVFLEDFQVRQISGE